MPKQAPLLLNSIAAESFTFVCTREKVAYGQKADFIKMMQERANLHIRSGNGVSMSREAVRLPSAARIAASPAKQMASDQKRPMMSDNGQYNPEGFNNGQYNPQGFNDGKYSERAEADAAIAAADRERSAQEKERQAQELERQREQQAQLAKAAQDMEEHQMKLREREQELEEKLKAEQQAREEQRIMREQAVSCCFNWLLD